MRAEGVVVAVEGEVATVSVSRQSACAGCSASCANCHKKEEHELKVPNSICAEIGESVWVESSGKVMLAIFVLLFVLPTLVAVVVCIALSGIMGDVLLFAVTFAAAGLCFALSYLTAGRYLIKQNTYRLVKKF